MGLQHNKIVNILFPSLSDIKKLNLMKEIDLMEINAIRQKGGRLYKNTIIVLETLKRRNYALSIVSNCQKGYIEAFLNYHKLEHFFLDYESSGNTGMEKSENMKLLMQRNSLPSSIYIGDTKDDLIACKKARIPFIFAQYGFGQNVEAHFQISDIGDLIYTNVLDLIGNGSAPL